MALICLISSNDHIGYNKRNLIIFSNQSLIGRLIRVVHRNRNIGYYNHGLRYRNLLWRGYYMIIAQISCSIMAIGCLCMAGYGALQNTTGWGWFAVIGLLALTFVCILGAGPDHCSNIEDEGEK